MKQPIFYMLFLFFIVRVSSQVFEVQALKTAGDIDKRINLVILSEGYQETEFDKFETDATNFMNAMFSQSPFAEYADYFNVYIIKVPSNESGADHPGTATDVTEPQSPVTDVDTYFNSTFDAFGYHRYLYYGIDYADAASAELKIRSVLADNFPTYDQTLILVNSSHYGGTGGEFPIASIHMSSSEIAIHELGHSLFNLKDEYLVPDVYYAEAINMTQETDPSLVKWTNWVGVNEVGVYPYGSSGTAATWNRPHQNCKMRYLGYSFCSVCQEGMIERIHNLLSPIDSYMPVSNTVDNPSLPIDFQLNLIAPIPNTLERVWTLNAVNFANNVDSISLEEIDLLEGENTLTAVVHDATGFLKIDNHETSHIYTVSWTINYSSLGIGNIKSRMNNYVISMYPNPTNNTINLKFESDDVAIVNVEIVGLDGRKVKSMKLSNFKNQQIDISAFSQGIYLTNFYSNKTLLATKKLVKN
ncbi:T9SS type A sorting domain-containing protein [Flavisericum labens]|uniref:T9SS type A sorting domain-containing protein n=1 Tax=Flavisericum labens TaxID=3377112 RepID=UPI00387B05DB